MREEVLSSATKFLQNPNVQSAALAKKVAFLESKGLTSDEIEEALARSSGKKKAPSDGPEAAAAGYMIPSDASSSSSPPPPTGYYYPQQQYMQHPPLPPPRPKLDWKDYFIAAVAFGGVTYGVFALTQKYIKPLLNWPSEAELKADKDRLDEQFKQAEETLEALKTETEKIVKTIAEQSDKTTGTLTGVRETLDQLKRGDAKRDEEFDTLKKDFENVKTSIPKMIDRNKESQTTVLNELQTEVKSLKSLLLSRRVGAGPGQSAGAGAAPYTVPGSSTPNAAASAGYFPSNTNTNPSTVNGNASDATTNDASQKSVIPGLSRTASRPNSIPAWQLAASGTKSAVTPAKSEGEERAESAELAEAKQDHVENEAA